MKKLRYKHNPVGSLTSLAAALRTTEKELNYLAENSDSLFYANTPEIKANGKVRQTYRVDDRLKIIQKRIVSTFFHRIDFPIYLQGSIKDKSSPRDYISDANLHTNSKTILSEDVTDFFPSINDRLVYEMWKKLFKFHPDVADVLTRLTTLKGFVPQGAPTSSYTANLVFWEKEPNLVDEFEKNGWVYSRYVDDITISSKTDLSKQDKTKIIAKIYAMLGSYRVSPNRKKHQIYNQSEAMRVHNLNVNSRRPTLPKKDREKVRAAVYECESYHSNYGQTVEYKSLFSSTLGRVNHLKRLHPVEGKKLVRRLNKVKPRIT
jgi:hypothetical protein